MANEFVRSREKVLTKNISYSGTKLDNKLSMIKPNDYYEAH